MKKRLPRRVFVICNGILCKRKSFQLMRKVGIEPTRISPEHLKCYSLTSRTFTPYRFLQRIESAYNSTTLLLWSALGLLLRPPLGLLLGPTLGMLLGLTTLECFTVNISQETLTRQGQIGIVKLDGKLSNLNGFVSVVHVTGQLGNLRSIILSVDKGNRFDFNRLGLNIKRQRQNGSILKHKRLRGQLSDGCISRIRSSGRISQIKGKCLTAMQALEMKITNVEGTIQQNRVFNDINRIHSIYFTMYLSIDHCKPASRVPDFAFSSKTGSIQTCSWEVCSTTIEMLDVPCPNPPAESIVWDTDRDPRYTHSARYTLSKIQAMSSMQHPRHRMASSLNRRAQFEANDDARLLCLHSLQRKNSPIFPTWFVRTEGDLRL